MNIYLHRGEVKRKGVIREEGFIRVWKYNWLHPTYTKCCRQKQYDFVLFVEIFEAHTIDCCILNNRNSWCSLEWYSFCYITSLSGTKIRKTHKVLWTIFCSFKMFASIEQKPWRDLTRTSNKFLDFGNREASCLENSNEKMRQKTKCSSKKKNLTPL